MTAGQKRAWLIVIVGSLCVVGYLAMLPIVGAKPAMAVFGLFGIVGFTPFIGRREKSDERDVSIHRMAFMGGAAASYLTFIFGCMGTWTVMGQWKGHEQISIEALPLITGAGGFVFFYVHSIVVLVLYGRNREVADHA